MKQKSRLGSRFLALLLIFTMLCTAVLPVSAASAPALSAANATAKVGDTFTVAVSLKNAASVYNGNFTLQYDSSVLEVQSYTYGNIFNGHTKNCNLDYQSTGNQIRFTFSGAYALTGDGALVTFTFKAKAAGSSDLQFTAYKMYDENGVSLSPTATNGTATVSAVAVASPVLSVANATAKVGDTFTVAVSLKNAASVYNGNFTLQYDSSVLEVQSYTYGDIFNGHTKNCNLDYQSTGNQIRFTFSGAYALTGDGTLVTFTFKAKTAGSSDLQFTAYKMYDENGVSIATTVSNGSVIVDSETTNTISGQCGESAYYTYNSDTHILTITGTGDMWDWNRTPSDGGETAPWYDNYIETIYIEEGIESIGECAFSGQSALHSVTIADSVTRISDEAFYGCSSLTSVTIPGSVTNIGDRAFGQCTSITNITMQNGVTSFGVGAFYNCSSLTDLTIPDSVISIGVVAFGYCKSLVSVTLPDSMTSISQSTFTGCSSLANITIPSSVTSIGSYAFTHCTSLTSITIPDSVTSIDEYTFYSCTSLKSVEIPNSVTYIGDYAFYDCAELTGIRIPNNVTSIGGWAFCDCTSLTNITIPSGVTSISNGTFLRCTSLTSITIPDSVMEIGGYAFSHCLSLTSVIIPDSVTSIGNWAFDSCSSLTSITIPKNVEIIGTEAFTRTVVIYGYRNSAAEEYANTYGNEFIPLDPIELETVTIDSLPTKTQYYIGDSLNTSGLQLKLTYSDGSTEIISSGFTTSGFTSASAGTKTVTVSYGGKSTTFTVTVNTPTVSLSSTSKSMTVGDTATLTATTTPSGQTVTWTSSNTSVATVSGGKVTAVGIGTATITAKFVYNGQTYSKNCEVTVQESVPDGALRLDLPISGIIGQQVQIPIVLEDVALGGLDFTLQYDQTKLEFVSCTQNAFTYYSVNGDVPGQIKYGGVTATSVHPGQVTVLTFNVIANKECSTAVSLNVTSACADDIDCTDLNVIGGTWNLSLEKVLTAISIYAAPTKTQYYIGDSLNTSGLQLKLTYSDGSTEIISSGFTTSGFTSASAGTKTVTVSYGGKSTTFTVTVNTPTVSLSSTSKSMTVGDTATLTATTTPSGQTVTWTSSNTNVATVSNGTVTAKAAGTATITAKFTCNGIAYSKTCTITVAPTPVTLSSISVYSLPTKTQYYIGDSLNTSGLQLKLTYSDGSTEIISSGFTTSGFTSASAGTKTVIVSYGDKTTTFTVTVSVPVDAGTLYAQPSTARVGQQVNIPIYVNNATLGTLTFTVQFDSTKLKYISYSEEAFEMVSVGTLWDSQITVACINNSKITENGKVIVLTFEVLATENCNTDLTVSVIEATAPDANDTPVALTGGTWSLQIMKGIPGDVNGDGKITAVDARWVLQAASGARTFDATQTAAADVNGDGKISAVDARWILQAASGARVL